MTATPAEARQGLKSSSMSNLTLILIKIAYLAVLWLFVLMAVGVIRTDLFGQSKRKSRKKKPRPSIRPPQRRPVAASSSSSQARPQRARRNEPTVLAVTQGSLAGTTVDLASQPILIGRAPDSTLVITDDYASGRHARVYSENGRWFVEDLNSTNGTYLGQQKLNRPQPITVGQPIRIGKTVLELRK
ncbi:FHA domain-containing protein [Nocardiopsis alba]|uniref:FHA domain-containing protein n=2 Tax=Nocardiopsis alba TaxID=53437 RepID=A0A7K2ISC3_9ACTN|nr:MULTISPECIES: FHA domain-containing protein [Nocardiopsis]MEC3895773.1 FHA domain-containing protein [Nocardiopsis sp. LDBS1602]MYR32841.1 FHA domain-containing protein [Nocardiopsis alba]